MGADQRSRSCLKWPLFPSQSTQLGFWSGCMQGAPPGLPEQSSSCWGWCALSSPSPPWWVVNSGPLRECTWVVRAGPKTSVLKLLSRGCYPRGGPVLCKFLQGREKATRQFYWPFWLLCFASLFGRSMPTRARQPRLWLRMPFPKIASRIYHPVFPPSRAFGMRARV